MLASGREPRFSDGAVSFRRSAANGEMVGPLRSRGRHPRPQRLRRPRRAGRRARRWSPASRGLALGLPRPRPTDGAPAGRRTPWRRPAQSRGRALELELAGPGLCGHAAAGRARCPPRPRSERAAERGRRHPVNVLVVLGLAASVVYADAELGDLSIARSQRFGEAGQALALIRGGEQSAIAALRRDMIAAPGDRPRRRGLGQDRAGADRRSRAAASRSRSPTRRAASTSTRWPRTPMRPAGRLPPKQPERPMTVAQPRPQKGPTGSAEPTRPSERRRPPEPKRAASRMPPPQPTGPSRRAAAPRPRRNFSRPSARPRTCRTTWSSGSPRASRSTARCAASRISPSGSARAGPARPARRARDGAPGPGRGQCQCGAGGAARGGARQSGPRQQPGEPPRPRRLLTAKNLEAAQALLPQGFGFRSDLFRIRTTVRIGDTIQSVDSLLQRRTGPRGPEVLVIERRNALAAAPPPPAT